MLKQQLKIFVNLIVKFIPVCRLFLFCFLLFNSGILAQIPEHKQNRNPHNFKGTSIHLGPLSKSQVRSDESQEYGGYHFAERRDVHLTPLNSGVWNQKDDQLTWTLDIQSDQAHSINLGFTEYHLPQGATLSIISESGDILGPFTKADNKDHLQLWTPIIQGDKLTLQLAILSENDIGKVRLTLSAINHGFTPVISRSGSCNIDVLCGTNEQFPLIDRFRDQIQSVANVQINGSLMCTGFLINNAANDFRPYFITAAHCGLRASTARTAVFYWNFQNSMCRPVDSPESGANGDGMLNQFNTGAQIISSAVDGNIEASSVDFTLVLLDDDIDPNFNPYYAGWDISTTPPDSSFCVHHPSGDEKRISFDFDTATFVTFGEDSVFVRVENYEMGTTESGSSGAPLFNTEGNAVGYVSGGNASCLRPDGFDEYGWLGLAFKNGDSAETRLSDWLDPNNTGATKLNGLNGSFAIKVTESLRLICGLESDSIDVEIEVDDNFKNDVALDVTNLPEGVSGRFTNNTPSPGTSTTLILENLNSLSTGIYTIGISGSDGENDNSNNFSIELISNLPSETQPTFPQANDIVNNLAQFTWDGDAITYDIEIADNISFLNPIVSENNISLEIFATNRLQTNHEYFWRIRGQNFCGNSSWSEPILFRTSSLDCSLIEENGVNLEITEMRDDTVEASITIDVDETVQVVSIPLIEGKHTWSSDLVFSLISPAGTEVTLGTKLCDGIIQFADFKIGFDDLGISADQIPCPYTDGKIYTSEMPLAAFQGESTLGTWTLRVIDKLFLDDGILENWSMQICSESGLSLFPNYSDKVINGCGTDMIESSFEIPADFTSSVNINTATNASSLDIQLSQTMGSPGETIPFTINNINSLNNLASSIRFSLANDDLMSESVVIIDFESSAQAANLLLPLNEEVIKTGSLINFEWDDAEGAEEYILQVTTDPLFERVDREISVATSSGDVALDFITSQESIPVYWRVLTADQNCSAASNVFSFIADITDAIVPLANTELNIYPNPVYDKLNIESTGLINANLTIELIDLSGKRLQTINLSKGSINEQIDISNFPSGIYFMRVSTSIESNITKLIKS